MGGGPMPSKETSPRSSNPIIKSIANVIQMNDLRTYLPIIFSSIIILLLIRNLPFDVCTGPKFEIHSISFEYPFGRGIWAPNYLNISLTCINPNKDRAIICDDLVLTVFHKKERFLVGMLPPIKQGAGEEILVEETVAVALGSVHYPAFLDGEKNYSIKIDGRMKYAPGTFWKSNATSYASLSVLFDNVTVEFSAPDREVETSVTVEPPAPGEENGWVEKVVLLTVCGLCLVGFCVFGLSVALHD